MPPESPEKNAPNSAHQMNVPEKLVHEAIGLAYSAFGQPNHNTGGDGKGRNLTTKALDMLQILPYAAYFSAYETGKGINWVGDHLGAPGKVAAHALALPLVPMEVAGLAGNELIGIGILASNHGKSNMYEGITGGIVPSFISKDAPKVYLPGIRQDGSIDFSW